MAKVPYEKHIFVCINQRDADHPRGDCASKGGVDLHANLKQLVRDRLPGAPIRVNKAGCLDTCECGVSMVVYPDGVWYGQVNESDLEEIVESHLKDGKVVERLVSDGRPPLKDD